MVIGQMHLVRESFRQLLGVFGVSGNGIGMLLKWRVGLTGWRAGGLAGSTG